MTAIANQALPQVLEAIPGDGFARHNPSNWTCYSAGEATTERVMEAAESSSTPPDILGMLAESCDVKVRMAIADNGSALLETLMMLAQDESADLRYQLAENHNIHESVLKLLSVDSHPYVAHRAKKTLARLRCGAVILVHPAVSLYIAATGNATRAASLNGMGSKLNRIAL
jgi:hypothetical protein